jgi:serine/threonine protein phosphatase PrpC
VGAIRIRNEDAFLVADVLTGTRGIDRGMTRFEVGAAGALLAVSDGMGGHKAGEVASSMTLATLLRALSQKPEPGAGAAATGGGGDALIQSAVEQANTEVFDAGRSSEYRNMGATVTAVLVDGETAHIAEVGDSRAYLIRGGVIRQLTTDQSYVEALVAAGALTPEQARASAQRNILLQAVGQTKDVVVALSTLSLRQRDCLLLCSDGLTLHLDDEEIKDVVLASRDLDEACERLVALANDRGGEDNVTVVLAGVSGDLPPLVASERISRTHVVLQSFEARR